MRNSAVESHPPPMRSDAGQRATHDESHVASRPPMRNLSRERSRAELEALRKEVEALEHHRNVLLRRREHQQFPEDVVNRWKCAAENEQALRRRAESENERLAAMLRQQVGLASVLERLLRERLRETRNKDKPTKPTTHSHPTRSPRIDHDTSLGMLHAQFSRDIQRIYKAGVGSIFAGNDWSAVAAEIGGPVVREDKTDEITNAPMVSLRETRHIPFEYQRVADAMWRCAIQPFIEAGRLIESYVSDDDQIAFKYNAVTPSKRERGDLLTAVMVLQKFEEPNRTVHVWRIISSATEEHPSAFQRAFGDETGWFIIEPVPPGVPGIEAGTAVLRIVSHHVPLWTHDLAHGSGGKLTACDFDDLVVEAMREDMVALGDAVGNLLLDESLGLC